MPVPDIPILLAWAPTARSLTILKEVQHQLDYCNWAKPDGTLPPFRFNHPLCSPTWELCHPLSTMISPAIGNDLAQRYNHPRSNDPGVCDDARLPRRSRLGQETPAGAARVQCPNAVSVSLVEGQKAQTDSSVAVLFGSDWSKKAHCTGSRLVLPATGSLSSMLGVSQF